MNNTPTPTDPRDREIRQLRAYLDEIGMAALGAQPESPTGPGVLKVVQALKADHSKLAAEIARMLASNGQFRSDVLFAIAGTREQLPDEQIIETAKSVAAEIAELKRSGRCECRFAEPPIEYHQGFRVEPGASQMIWTNRCALHAVQVDKETATLRAELEALKGRAQDVSQEEANELQAILRTLAPSGRALVHSARQLVELWEKQTSELEAARKEREAWMETAAQHLRNEVFYRGIVTKIGERFGVAAKTSDDGSIQDDVLALKVPELVDTALAAKDAAERLLNALESIPKTHAIGLAPSGTWQYFGEKGDVVQPTRTARELLESIAALTPAPTQEPPAGGVTISNGPACGPTGETASQDAPSVVHGSGVATGSIQKQAAADVPSEGRGEWLPIETAPDDKTELMLGWKKLVCSGHWDEKLNAWVTSYGTYRGSFNPTHWQPLPPPPMLPTEGSGA